VLYGLAAIVGLLGIQDLAASPEAAEEAAGIGESLAALVLLVVAGLIDKWHHKQDTSPAQAGEVKK
jgi:hypothetical protein